MQPRIRLLAVSCALVLLAGVISAFTVDDDDQQVASEAGASSVDSDIDVDTGDSATTTTNGSDDDGNDDGEADTSDSTTTAAPSDAETTTTNGAQVSTTVTAPTPATVPVGVTPTTPGTYTYDISGCCDEDGKNFSGSSKLTVPAPDARGRQAQKQSGPEGTSTTTYRFTAEGMYLESMSVSAQGQTIKLSATGPFLVIPAGASQGATSSGQLKGSGLTANVTFTLVELGADTAVAEIKARISGTVGGICNVSGTMDSTITARRSDQLPLETTSESDISSCLGDMDSHSKSTLRA